MADQKLRELTETTTPVSTDLAYLVVDPDGTPLDRKVEIGTLLGNLGACVNLAQNSPGQIYGGGIDGTEPQWWDDVANATITDEDAAGEGIEEMTERVFKVVTVADDVYGYQTLTFANESLLDAGETTVSFSCWVWCDAASTASIAIYGTNLGLQESDQHTGGSSWELLTVENQTLDAADTSIQLRLIVDTDTAYFTKPMLNPGSCAMPWMPRGLAPYLVNRVSQVNGTGDQAWADTDCTANTHPLAVKIDVQVYVTEPNGTPNSYVGINHASALTASDQDSVRISCAVVGAAAYYFNNGTVMCDDSQIIRYHADEIDGDNDFVWNIRITGYWRWAP